LGREPFASTHSVEIWNSAELRGSASCNICLISLERKHQRIWHVTDLACSHILRQLPGLPFRHIPSTNLKLPLPGENLGCLLSSDPIPIASRMYLLSSVNACLSWENRAAQSAAPHLVYWNVARAGDVGPAKCHFSSGRRLRKLERQYCQTIVLFFEVIRKASTAVCQLICKTDVPLKAYQIIDFYIREYLYRLPILCRKDWSVSTENRKQFSHNLCIEFEKCKKKRMTSSVCAFCSLLSPLFNSTVQKATWLGCIAVLHSTLHFTRFPWDRGYWPGCRVYLDMINVTCNKLIEITRLTW
jgi:hypothetical protein